MPRTLSPINSGTSSKETRLKFEDNDCEEIVREKRRGSLKALSDYESDDCSDMAKDSLVPTNSYKKQTNYSSSDNSSVIVSRRSFNKHHVVASANSDNEKNHLTNQNSRKFPLRVLSDYETGESNEKSASSSSSYQKRRFKSKLSAAKNYATSDSYSDSEVIQFNKKCKRKRALASETDTSDSEVIQFNKKCKRKRALASETDTSDSDLQKRITHIAKKKRTKKGSNTNDQDQASSESNAECTTNTSQQNNVPTNSRCTISATGQQYPPKSIKRVKKKRMTKRRYSSSGDSDSSYSSIPNPWRAPTDCDKPPRPSTFLKLWKKQRVIISDENHSSSEDGYEDSLNKLSSHRITKSFFNKETGKKNISSSSENISEDLLSTPEVEVRQNTLNRNKSSLSLINSQQLHSTKSNFPSDTDNSWEDSLDEHEPPNNKSNVVRNDSSNELLNDPGNLNTFNIQRTNSLNSRVTRSCKFPSQENLPLLTNTPEQHSTRQLSPRNILINMPQNNLNNTSHPVPVQIHEFSSDSDISPRFQSHSQRRILSNNDTSSSDSGDVVSTSSRNDLNTTYTCVRGATIDNSIINSDIRQKIRRHSQRTILVSDHTSSSDSSEYDTATFSRNYFEFTNGRVASEERNDFNHKVKLSRPRQGSVSSSSNHTSSSNNEDVIATGTNRVRRVWSSSNHTSSSDNEDVVATGTNRVRSVWSSSNHTSSSNNEDVIATGTNRVRSVWSSSNNTSSSDNEDVVATDTNRVRSVWSSSNHTSSSNNEDVVATGTNRVRRVLPSSNHTSSSDNEDVVATGTNRVRSVWSSSNHTSSSNNEDVVATGTNRVRRVLPSSNHTSSSDNDDNIVTFTNRVRRVWSINNTSSSDNEDVIATGTNRVRRVLPSSDHTSSSDNEDVVATGTNRVRRVLPSSDHTSSSDNEDVIATGTNRVRRVLPSSDHTSSSDNEDVVAKGTNRVRRVLPSSDHTSSSDNEDVVATGTNRVRRVLPSSDHTSSSDNEDVVATGTNRVRRVLPSSDYTSSSDNEDVIATGTNRVRRVLPSSDHTSSSDNEDVVATSSRIRGSKYKLDSDDQEGKTENSSSDSDNDSEKCPICFDKFRLQEVGSPESCDHSFCASCIQEWAKNNNTCPVDRKVFNTIKIRTHLQGRIDRQVPIETPRNPFEELFNVLSVLTGAGENTFEVFNIESDDSDEICCLCHSERDNDDIIACDMCFHVFHLGCLTPPLRYIPASNWYCTDCQLLRSMS